MITATTRKAIFHKFAALTLLLFALLALAVQPAYGQTPTAFTYQGRLSDGGAPANGTYDLQFTLYNSGGAPVGDPPLVRAGVTVVNGVFTVQLDFDANAFTSGQASTLEIGVKPGGAAGAFTILSPRQPLTATPYAIQTVNATQLGGVAASQYVQTNDVRLTDARTPMAGSTNYIQNTQVTPGQQTGASFNISGDGIVGGNVGIGTTTPQAKLEVVGSLAKLPNNVALAVGVQGNQVQFGSPNGETGMTISGTSGRADLRFDGTLKLVAGPAGQIPPPTNGVAINTSGNVGIGTINPSLLNGGSGRLVSVSDSFNPGIALTNTGAGGRQFFLYSTNAGSSGSFRVFDATSSSDRLIIDTNGNAVQQLSSNGLVKATLYVEGNGTLRRCYNGITGASTETCGFSVTRFGNGDYEVDFGVGFQVSDRFISITTSSTSIINRANTSAQVEFDFRRPNTVIRVHTFAANDFQTTSDSDFFIIVY